MTAFKGLPVLDYSTGVAGPVAGVFFADCVADVIKVDAPSLDSALDRPGYALGTATSEAFFWIPGSRKTGVE
jgi:crotonobetainyl-CoA:carnitine CoA-transferase CaiB-like acyl-CoA transferase